MMPRMPQSPWSEVNIIHGSLIQCFISILRVDAAVLLSGSIIGPGLFHRSKFRPNLHIRVNSCMSDISMVPMLV